MISNQQIHLLEKIGKTYNLGKNYSDTIAKLFLPSKELLRILDGLSSSELGILKSIYYEYSPDFTKNICNKFSDLKKPILTIITSVFNGDKYIEEFMANTCSQQGFEYFELILIDCNSPGSELAIIEKYTCKHPNIKYIKLSKDPGLYEAWNIGVREASGIYLSNANLDDRKSPAYYALLLNFLLDNDYDILGCLFWTCRVLPENDIHDLPIVWYKNEPSNIGYLDMVKIDRSDNIFKDQCLLGPFPIWKKALHKRSGFFIEEKYGPSSDYEFWVRSICLGAKAHLYKVPLGFYLKDPGSYARRSSVDKYNNRILCEKFTYLHSLSP